MIYWAQLLHFYQPPTQLHAVLEKVCEESYRPLLQVFRDHPHARATVNINATLTEMLHDHGMEDVVDGLRALGERGQIEFVGSGKYHPILPLISREEMDRQIALNRRTNRYYIGEEYNPQGFFPPEMCYGPDVAEAVLKGGHKWIIVSGIADPVVWPVDTIHQIKLEDGNLAVFYRDDVLSNKISFQDCSAREFLKHLQSQATGSADSYVVTAMDAETYGHHIQGWERLFLASVYDEIRPGREVYADIKQTKQLAGQQTALLEAPETKGVVSAVTISELLDVFPLGEVVQPRSSSWSTTWDDIKEENPYPLWLARGNDIHHLQWEHTRIMLDMVRRAFTWADNDQSRWYATIARGLVDRSLYSCQYWWASRRPMWDINMVNRGLIEQWSAILNSYKSVKTSGVSEERKRENYYLVVAARDLRNKITDKLFLD